VSVARECRSPTSREEEIPISALKSARKSPRTRAAGGTFASFHGALPSAALGHTIEVGRKITCEGRAGDCLPVYEDLPPASTSAPRQNTGKLSKTMVGRLTRRSPGARGGEARPAVSRVRGDRTADRIECGLSLGQILVLASATRWNTQSRVTKYGWPRHLKFPGGAAARRRKGSFFWPPGVGRSRPTADPQPSPWEWSSCPEAALRYLVAPEVASLFWIDTRGPIHGCLYSDISRPRPRFTAAAKFSSLPPNRLTHSSSVVSARHLKTRGA